MNLTLREISDAEQSEARIIDSLSDLNLSEDVAKQGAPEELRWCLSFDETDKPMVLNRAIRAWIKRKAK